MFVVVEFVAGWQRFLVAAASVGEAYVAAVPVAGRPVSGVLVFDLFVGFREDEFGPIDYSFGTH